MKMLVLGLALSALQLAGCAHHQSSPNGHVVLSRPDGARVASVAPTAIPYTEGGPTATAWLPEADAAKLPDGRVISGVMIRTWAEGDGARVQVSGMTTKPGEVATFTTNESELQAVELGSYHLRPKQTAAISELASLGVEPLTLSY